MLATTTPPLSMAGTPQTSSGGPLERLARVLRGIRLSSPHAYLRPTTGRGFPLEMGSTLIAMMTSIPGNEVQALDGSMRTKHIETQDLTPAIVARKRETSRRKQ